MRSITFETRRETCTEYLYGPLGTMARPMGERMEGSPTVAVVDSEIVEHHLALVDEVLSGTDCLGRIAIRGGEECKSLHQLGELLGELEELRIPKHGTVVAIGGGTVCDLAGLAALLINRSVGLVLVPTTVMGQVDAAVGGKNGINTGRRKNLIGHFHHPDLVISDPRFLLTLPRRQVVSGAAECVKVFAVSGEEVLDAHRETVLACQIDPGDLGPWQAAIWDAARLKLELLAEDPFERSSRRLLNYGHAFAHSFEEISRHALLHGEAVLLGMMIENEVGRELGCAGDGLDDLQDLITQLLTPACGRHFVTFEHIHPELDKLRALRRGAMNLVCPSSPGRATIVDDAPDEALAAAWQRTADLVGGRLSATGVPV